MQDKKLGRSAAHREALMASLVCNLIERKRIRTTLVKAKQARRVAERMVTLGKRGTLAARRRAAAVLHNPEAVRALFADVAPRFEERAGGYTRIVKLGRRNGDGAETAVLEWVGAEPPAPRKKRKQAEGESAAKA
ncbi:MAG: 50S ribosomal protein L17 [Lentisphaerae bacterium]|nr:50S ribosomal protein L17 [Lentisphaerota bacterium]